MKKIYSDFLGGLSYYDRNAPTNQYYEGREIDPHRGAGYLRPGWELETVTKSDDSPQIIDGLINDICIDQTTNDAYFCDDNHLYHMTSVISETWDSDFDGSSHYYYAITGANAVYKLAIYAISGTNYLLYAWRDTGTKGDVGIYNLADTFNDDYLSTDVGSGAAALQDAPIDMLEWKTYMFIGHGRYVGRFDGPNDTWNATKLDLGQGWEVTKLFPTQSYLGICAWKKHSSGGSYRTESRVFFWDGTSDSFNYWVPIGDNKISTAFNKDGQILLFTYGRDLAATLREMTQTGADKIRKLKTPISGTVTNFTAPGQNAVDNFGNRVIFGTEHLVWSYGQEERGHPMAITIPWGVAYADNSAIGAVKTVFYNKVFISYSYINGGSKYYLLKARTGNSPRATYKGIYTDLGQKARVNYVKFYFKPLESGDSVTPTLNVDYGTSVTLTDPNGNTTISYANDGAITSKKFWVKKDCHAFRPEISWTSGGVAFSKIVIDYDFIND